MYTFVFDRETSSSWGSISELVALAMSSNQSERLKNTGAGIDDDEDFEQRTQVIDKYGSLQQAVVILWDYIIWWILIKNTDNTREAKNDGWKKVPPI